jgi:surfeit locus 1 family protein
MRTPPLLPTFFTLLGVFILCSLGTWQVQRLEWKQAILQKLDDAYAGEHTQKLDFSDMGEDDFRYGRAEGLFQSDKALLLGPRTRDNKTGADLIVPLKLKQGTLLVNMGWTDGKLESLPIHHLRGKKVWFEGLARRAHWNAFTPENNPDADLWYRPDIAEIVLAKDLDSPLPFFLFADRASHKFDASFPNNKRWAPPNDHLQYAIFWFTMAGALLVIYALRFLKKN